MTTKISSAPPAIAPDLEALDASVRSADGSRLPPRSRAAHARMVCASARLAAAAREFDAAALSLAKALKHDGVDA